MAQVRHFRDLEAWQAAMDLAEAAHRAASKLPMPHRYELGGQIRKSATSIPSNVAEGHAQRGDRVFLRHIRIALGSLAELDTQIELAVRQGLIGVEEASRLAAHLVRTGQLVGGLRRALLHQRGNDLASIAFVLFLAAIQK